MSCRCDANSIFSQTKNDFLCFVCTACNRAQPCAPLKNYMKCSCGECDLNKWKFDFSKEYIICGDCNQVLIH